MEEATGEEFQNQRGQALIEYVLIMVLALFFLRFVYFNSQFGFKAALDKTMLRLGVYLEQNLKTGTQPGAPGAKSVNQFAGTSDWTN